MIQRTSSTPHRFRYLALTNLTLLGLLVTTLCFLGRPAYADPTTQDVFQPFVRINSDAPIGDQNVDNQTFPCQAPNAKATCYGPKQMYTAYDIQPLLDSGTTGKGSTIVILDAFQAPQIQDDLQHFDKAFGLNDPELNIISPDGLTPFNPQDDQQVSWSAEISLDVEWSHAIAPDATIDLVLAKSDSDQDLLSALNDIVDEGQGDILTMSFGQNESCMDNQSLWHKAFRKATSEGMTLIASSGDTGAAETACDGSTYVQEVSYPAVDPFITAVGGTQLHADLSTGAYHNEVSWNEPNYHSASGGGFSTSIPKPFYENSVDGMGQYRGIPDVSYAAGVSDGGVLVKWSEAPKGPGFYIIGGTSSGSPQWAGIAALADQYGQNRIGLINPVLYCLNQGSRYSSTFYDVNSGNNTITLQNAQNKPVTIQGYSAGRNWDATTGWGSPQVANLVPLLAHHDDVVNVSSNDLDSL